MSPVRFGRRGLLATVTAALIAPRLVRAESIMPVKVWNPTPAPLPREFLVMAVGPAGGGDDMCMVRAVELRRTMDEMISSPRVTLRMPAAALMEMGVYPMPGYGTSFGFPGPMATGEAKRLIERAAGGAA